MSCSGGEASLVADLHGRQARCGSNRSAPSIGSGSNRRSPSWSRSAIRSTTTRSCGVIAPRSRKCFTAVMDGPQDADDAGARRAAEPRQRSVGVDRRRRRAGRRRRGHRSAAPWSSPPWPSASTNALRSHISGRGLTALLGLERRAGRAAGCRDSSAADATSVHAAVDAVPAYPGRRRGDGQSAGSPSSAFTVPAGEAVAGGGRRCRQRPTSATRSR